MRQLKANGGMYAGKERQQYQRYFKGDMCGRNHACTWLQRREHGNDSGGIRQTGLISQLFYETQEGKPFLSDLVLPGRRPGHDTFCQTHVKPDGTV